MTLVLLAPTAFGADPDVLTAERFEALRAEARDRANALPSAAAVESAAESPARFEALADAWMTRRFAEPRLSAADRSALRRWSRRAPLVWTEHHEFPNHAMPAFSIAERARVLLNRDAIVREADRLRADPERLAGLTRQPALAATTLRAARLALAELSADAHRRLADYWTAAPRRAKGDAEDPAGADALRLALARHRPGDRALWRSLIDHAEPRIARRTLAAAMELKLDHLGDLAERGLARPELGGVALSAWLAAGGRPDARCWELLDDPNLGADAALALARGSEALVQGVRTGFADAAPLAQVRMRLALRLRDSEDSRALLRTLESEGPLLAVPDSVPSSRSIAAPGDLEARR